MEQCYYVATRNAGDGLQGVDDVCLVRGGQVQEHQRHRGVHDVPGAELRAGSCRDACHELHVQHGVRRRGRRAVVPVRVPLPTVDGRVLEAEVRADDARVAQVAAQRGDCARQRRPSAQIAGS